MPKSNAKYSATIRIIKEGLMICSKIVSFDSRCKIGNK